MKVKIVIVFIILICIVIAFLVLNFLFCFFLKYDYNLDENIIVNEIEEILNGKFIYSFNVRDICREDEEIFIFAHFDEIPYFCNCYGKNIGEGSCSDYNYNDDCITVNSIGYRNYKRIINSSYICVKKSNFTYLDKLNKKDMISKDEECPENYKSCGIVDTLDRKLCVRNEEDCPIQKADIEKNNLFENNDTNQILSIFKLEQDFPCLSPREKNWNFLDDLKPISSKCKNKINNQYHDFRYEMIEKFTTTQYDLYKSNSLLGKIKSNINSLKNEKVYLYGRRFIGLDIKKGNEFSKDKLISAQDLINRCVVAIKVATIIVIVFTGILSLGLEKEEGDDDSPLPTLDAFVVICSPGLVVDFILCIIIFVYHNKITSILNIGTDEYMEELIKDVISRSSINFIIPLINIILFLLMLIFEERFRFLIKKYYLKK